MADLPAWQRQPGSVASWLAAAILRRVTLAGVGLLARCQFGGYLGLDTYPTLEYLGPMTWQREWRETYTCYSLAIVYTKRIAGHQPGERESNAVPEAWNTRQAAQAAADKRNTLCKYGRYEVETEYHESAWVLTWTHDRQTPPHFANHIPCNG